MGKRFVFILIGLFVITFNGAIWAESQKPATAGPPFSTKPANVIIVAQSGGDFTSISAALASLPDPNTTPVIIKVMPGTYTESIIMKSNINIQGSGRDVTTIQAASSSDTVIIDTITNAAISGFTIKNWATGWGSIWVNSSSPLIKDNYITGGWSGIYNTGSATPRIVENKIAGNGHGIYNMTASPIIERNEITDNNFGYGILSRDSSFPVITGNTITGNHWGIMDYDVSLSKITENRIQNNQVGVYFDGGSTVVARNIVTNNVEKDIQVIFGRNPIINFNIFDVIEAGTWSGSYNVRSDGTPW